MSRQGDLFRHQPQADPGAAGEGGPPSTLPLLRRQILSWQERLAGHQGPLFAAAAAGRAIGAAQGDLFAAAGGASAGAAAVDTPESAAAGLDPLALTAQSLSFWRWPTAPQQGAALYLVIDRPPHLDQALLLYVGETGSADRRWRGEHDCKAYLAAYGEALHGGGLTARLSIRFCTDVPEQVRPRRALEQAMIRRWLPPFNKETRERWATPFTAEVG